MSSLYQERAGKRKAGAWMKTGAKVTLGWDSPKFFARYFFENSSAYRNRQRLLRDNAPPKYIPVGQGPTLNFHLLFQTSPKASRSLASFTTGETTAARSHKAHQ